MSHMRYEAVVFDMDGTLLDTLQDLTDCVNAVLRDHGMPERTPEEIRHFVGNGVHHLLDCAVPDGEKDPEFDKIETSYRALYKAHCMDKTEPYPGVLHLMDTLRKAGCRIAIVSNKPDATVRKLTGIYFDGLADTAVGEKADCRVKPAPDSVFLALNELGIPKERAVYVGDSEVDIRTAENAAMNGITVSWGFRSRDELIRSGADPKRIASNVNELLALLGYDGQKSSVQEYS